MNKEITKNYVETMFELSDFCYRKCKGVGDKEKEYLWCLEGCNRKFVRSMGMMNAMMESEKNSGKKETKEQ